MFRAHGSMSDLFFVLATTKKMNGCLSLFESRKTVRKQSKNDPKSLRNGGAEKGRLPESRGSDQDGSKTGPGRPLGRFWEASWRIRAPLGRHWRGFGPRWAAEGTPKRDQEAPKTDLGKGIGKKSNLKRNSPKKRPRRKAPTAILPRNLIDFRRIGSFR